MSFSRHLPVNELRTPCGDYRLVNTQIDKLTPNLPTGTVELEKASGHDYYYESDSVACYSSFVLEKGLSREALAVWTPIGLLQPTVLPFGQKNSGTEAQGPHRAAAASLKNLANYVDDWLGCSNDLEQLFLDFEKFLMVCAANNITLNVHKTRFGFPTKAQFFGFEVDKAGIRLAEKHLNPLENLVPPMDIPELRRVLGLFQVSRRFIDHYAHIALPMSSLLRGQKPAFVWGAEQQAAFETIRSELLAGVHLCPPDYGSPFHLATDASDDGKGGVLYQLPSIPLDQQHPHDPAVHSPDNMAIISFYSKCWPEALRGRPPFYLEADALLWGMEKARFYALSSPFTLCTCSDHAPLRWINKSDKGAVSSFVIEPLSDLDTTHQCVPGRFMTIPDSASRHPMLGPRRLAPLGLLHSVQELLDRLPSALKQATKTQTHAGENSADLHRAVQKWRLSKGSAVTALPLSAKLPPTVDLAILVPRPDVSPQVLARCLTTSFPFAVLIPVDLVSQTYNPTLFRTGGPCPKATKKAFAACGTITCLQSQMMWVIGNVPTLDYPEMFVAQLVTPAPLLEAFDAVLLVDVPCTLEDWIQAQQDDPDFASFVDKLPGAAVRADLHVYAPDDAPPKMLVPASKRESLIRRTHEAMFHLGHAKVKLALAQSCFWPELATDCRRRLKDCPGCELEKARRNEAHAMFSAAPSTAPRSRLCMDFQGQGKAETGHTRPLLS
jgi:hypothetical protein